MSDNLIEQINAKADQCIELCEQLKEATETYEALVDNYVTVSLLVETQALAEELNNEQSSQ